VIAGLITFALVGMLQSLGALTDTVPVDPAWRSDASGEDERGHATGRGAPSPAAIGPAALSAPHRGQPGLELIRRAAAAVSTFSFRSPESRGPPALLTRVRSN
jgi:hypothetical protein